MLNFVLPPFARDLAERVAASFAGTVVTVLGADVVNIVDVNWGTTLSLGAGAAVVSFLKGIAARFRGNPDSASLSREV